jgi:hypothetical protein
VLFGIAAALYTVLLAATALKALCHPQRLKAELHDPSRLFGHYTLVAASGVLAARLAATPFADAATALFALAALAWAVLSVAAVRALRTAPHRMLQQAATQLVTAQGSNVPATPERPLAWTATAAWLAVHIRFLTSRRTARP